MYIIVEGKIGCAQVVPARGKNSGGENYERNLKSVEGGEFKGRPRKRWRNSVRKH